MKNFRIAIALLGSLTAFSSCCNNAKVEVTVADAPKSDIVVKLLDVNKYKVLDTVKTDDKGRFTYKQEMMSGQPEFVYLFYKDTKIASLLLQKGDKVKVSADTLGTYSVSGSDETLKLMEVERDEAEFNDKLYAESARMEDLDPSSAEAVQARKEIASQYIAYYRGRVKYILQNSHSLTVIPVLYQTVGDGLPVFGQATDAIHFRNMADSLKTVYPESRYVKALDKEASRRFQMLELNNRIQTAESAGFPDVELPDVNGNKVKLSSLKSKVVMLYFWDASDATQKMFNQDALKPAYNEYHSKGFDIYGVSVSSDKAAWASVVKNQQLGWTNVSDSNGTAANLYNISSLPIVFFIVNGSLVNAPEVKDAATLRKFLASKLG